VQGGAALQAAVLGATAAVVVTGILGAFLHKPLTVVPACSSFSPLCVPPAGSRCVCWLRLPHKVRASPRATSRGVISDMKVLEAAWEQIYGLLVEDGQIAIGTLLAFVATAAYAYLSGEDARDSAGWV